MSVLDIVLAIVILGVVAWEGIRGFGKACFDGLGLYGALWITSETYIQLSQYIHLSDSHAGNQGIAFGLCFTVLAAVALVLSHYIHNSIHLDLGMMNQLLGVAAGVAVALILSHGMVRTIDISAGSPTPSPIANSSLGEEALNFDSYHAIVASLYSSTAPRQSASTN